MFLNHECRTVSRMQAPARDAQDITHTRDTHLVSKTGIKIPDLAVNQTLAPGWDRRCSTDHTTASDVYLSYNRTHFSFVSKEKCN